MTPPTAAAPAAPPADSELRSTLKMLLAPALFYLARMVLGLEEVPLLVPAFGIIYGIILFQRSLRDPEPLLAITIIYLPLSKQFPLAVAPLINGSNVLELMLLIAWGARVSRERRRWLVPQRHSGLVWAWAGLSGLSVITAVFTLDLGFILEDHLLDVKAWMDQFFVYFAFLNLISDGKAAGRVVLYMVIGYLLVVLLGSQELLEKMDASSIEKSRLNGPQLQPNDFGAFLTYGSSVLLAYFLHHLRRPKSWVLVPLFVLLAKLMLTTFSRGAYIGFGVAAVVAGYVRGKLFLASGLLLGVGLLVAFPQLIPASFTDRMNQTKAEDDPEKMDKSAETRLILWKAAVAMTMDHPLLGTGFKAFQVLKSDYTETEVEESDNHNMYLFICSQMGIPALVVFLVMLARMYLTGASLYRRGTDDATRIIGLGAATLVAGVLGVNMFGSRMGDMQVNCYFWIYLAALGHVWAEHEGPVSAAPPPPPRRPMTVPGY